MKKIFKETIKLAENNFHAPSTPSLSVFFCFVIEQCIYDFTFFLLRTYVRKGNYAKNPAILRVIPIFFKERTQLNAAHAWEGKNIKLAIKCGVGFLEITVENK